MKYLIASIAALFLIGCDQQQPVKPPETQTQQIPLPAQQTTQSPGMLEHMAGAAVAGAAAGSAGAVAHNMTNRAMDKWETRKRAKRIQRIRSRR